MATKSPSSSNNRLIQWLAIALLVIVADQFTKVLILHSFQYGDSHYVLPFFNLVRVHNTGAAFSFLAGASGWQRWFFVGLGVANCVWWPSRRRSSSSGCCAATATRRSSRGRSA